MNPTWGTPFSGYQFNSLFKGSDHDLKKRDFQGHLYEKPYILCERSQKVIQRIFKWNIPILTRNSENRGLKL